jgi:hypothetical protein
MLNLRVAFKTEIGIALNQHLPVHGPMWDMTDRASFTESFMLENKRSRLFAMTLRAILI